MRERANQLRTSLAAIAGFEVVMEGQDMRAVILTLATGQSVPWHYHTDITDSFMTDGRGDQSTSRDTCANAWTALRSAAQNCSSRSWEGWRPLQVHGSARRWRVRQRCCWWLLISPSMLSRPARHAITPSVMLPGPIGALA